MEDMEGYVKAQFDKPLQALGEESVSIQNNFITIFNILLVQLYSNSFIVINVFIFTGMANGVYGTFRESAVSITKIGKTLNYSKLNLEREICNAQYHSITSLLPIQIANGPPSTGPNAPNHVGEEEEQELEHKQEERDAQKHGSTEDGVTESVAANGEN